MSPRIGPIYPRVHLPFLYPVVSASGVQTVLVGRHQHVVAFVSVRQIHDVPSIELVVALITLQDIIADIAGKPVIADPTTHEIVP